MVLFLSFSSCKKESENTFTIFKGLKIDFNETLASNEVYVEFALKKAESGSGMAKVLLTENGGSAPSYSADIAFGNRFSYASGVIILKASNPSTVSYLLTVLDNNGSDITSQVAITYPAGQQVVSEPVLITDKETKTFNEGTIAYIDYNIHSDDEIIKSVWLESFSTGNAEPSRVTIATLPDNVTETKNYRGVVRVPLNRGAGSKFRLYVTNEANDYIGDGYTSIKTNVNAEFEMAANKFIYALDTGATEQNPDLTTACFYSVSKKRTYNYKEAKENSADIDFGMILTPSGNTVVPYDLNFYSIDLGPDLSSLLMFDFSDWTTKKSFKFSPGIGQYPTGGTTSISANTFFTTNLNSGIAIDQLIAQGAFKNSILDPFVLTTIGNMFFFQTQEGKHGAVFINGFGKDYLGRWYANIDVKVKK